MSVVEHRTIGKYVSTIASEQPMPGGGSAAGVAGSMAAALAEMVIQMTKDPGSKLLNAREELQELRQRALELAYDDEQAYNGFLDAMKLPRSTDEEKTARKAAMQTAAEHSARIPLALAVVCVEVLTAMEAVVALGNKNLLGDAKAAIVLAQATVEISAVMVGENLGMIRDQSLHDDLKTSIEAATEMTTQLAMELRATINERQFG